jgi:hypothetical protein
MDFVPCSTRNGTSSTMTSRSTSVLRLHCFKRIMESNNPASLRFSISSSIVCTSWLLRIRRSLSSPGLSWSPLPQKLSQGSILSSAPMILIPYSTKPTVASLIGSMTSVTPNGSDIAHPSLPTGKTISGGTSLCLNRMTASTIRSSSTSNIITRNRITSSSLRICMTDTKSWWPLRSAGTSTTWRHTHRSRTCSPNLS